jgi:hypothetical protein
MEKAAIFFSRAERNPDGTLKVNQAIKRKAIRWIEGLQEAMKSGNAGRVARFREKQEAGK